MTDYNDMTLREELETRFKEAEQQEREAEFLARGWQPPAGYGTEDAAEAEFQDSEQQEQNSRILSLKSRFLDKGTDNRVEHILKRFPEYNILREAQQEMNKANLIGGDNYYHRLGMCEVGQMGKLSAAVGFAAGIAKEASDLYNKVPWSKTFSNPKLVFGSYINAIGDSYKDMKNNWEGLSYGLNNPDKDCKIWLDDLDIGTNTWKKQKTDMIKR